MSCACGLCGVCVRAPGGISVAMPMRVCLLGHANLVWGNLLQ